MESFFTPTTLDQMTHLYGPQIQEMKDWIQRIFEKKERRILWISGNPGCGKSTLCQLFLKSYPLDLRMIHGAGLRTSKQLETWFDLANTYKNILQCFKGGHSTMAILVEDIESFLLPSDRSGYSYFFQRIEQKMSDTNMMIYPIVCISKQSPLHDKKWIKWKSMCLNIHLPDLTPPILHSWMEKQIVSYPTNQILKQIPHEWYQQIFTLAQGDLERIRVWMIEIQYLSTLGSSFFQLPWSQVSKRILRVQPPKDDVSHQEDEDGVLQDWDGQYNEFFQYMFQTPAKQITPAQCLLWYSSDPFFVPYGMFENMIRWMTGAAHPKNWDLLQQIYNAFVQYFHIQYNTFTTNTSIMDQNTWYSHYALYIPWTCFHQGKAKWKTPQYSWMYNKTSYSLAYQKKKHEFLWKTTAPFTMNIWETECKSWISLQNHGTLSDGTKECLSEWALGPKTSTAVSTSTETSSSASTQYQWFNVFHLPIETQWKEELHPWPSPNMTPWQYVAPKRKYQRKKKKEETMVLEELEEDETS
jgi:energy-coupling factor transporter ATP-binding protein EcfA2